MGEMKMKMRKGLWSPDEDEKLSRCIAMYMNGSWSDIARKAGVQRCGKSCRRRWMNHLRPDLKRGRFTPTEISRVVELHNTLGNSTPHQQFVITPAIPGMRNRILLLSSGSALPFPPLPVDSQKGGRQSWLGASQGSTAALES
ncbi:hypothetical protein L7F22_022610 [Adiantum nelumboides]|nr:hypothetical protein [Adiantum nelumboides]